jgi:DNA replication protein DnaC
LIQNTEDKTCPLCNGTGWVLVKKDNMDRAQRCGCQSTPIYISKAEKANLPKRYWGFEMKSYWPHRDHVEAQQKIINKVEKFIKDYPAVEKGFLFQGIAGVGKTRLLCCIANDLMNKIESLDIFYIDWNNLVREMRAGEHHITRNYSEINRFIERLADVDLLLFDELGSSKISDLTPWVMDSIYYIFNKRYNNQKITLCATNFFDQAKEDSQSLRSRLEERIRSRLFEMTETLIIAGKDRRREL